MAKRRRANHRLAVGLCGCDALFKLTSLEVRRRGRRWWSRISCHGRFKHFARLFRAFVRLHFDVSIVILSTDLINVHVVLCIACRSAFLVVIVIV
jgi:hypothetical protein